MQIRFFIKHVSFLYILLIILFLLSSLSLMGEESDHILYINSYHEGYKWSDDIEKGLKIGLSVLDTPFELQVEYMDTQRVLSPSYITNLQRLYQDKFENQQFDVIITSDDAAFNFLLVYGEEIFGDTPTVFCGVNYFEESILAGYDHYTGVVERYDISNTIRNALDLRPQTETIYFIDDDSLTGKAIMKEFLKVVPEFSAEVDFVALDGDNLEDIELKVRTLPQDSLILYLIYFQDKQKNYFSYSEAISRISSNSNVPIFGVWDFHLDYGIVGGKLISGYFQGEMAARLAVEILHGESPENLPVITENMTQYAFDHTILNEYDILVEDLPENSRIINMTGQGDKHQILILNSYNKGLKWTDDIEKGIMDSLAPLLQDVEFTFDYMDVKNNPEPTYFQSLYDFLQVKYDKREFDVIITTDDDAFKFISGFRHFSNTEIPVFFCGVNYYDEKMIGQIENITGVLEAYNMKETIEIALQVHPDTKRFVVINDKTITGLGNRKNLEKLIPDYAGRVDFEFWDDLNMADIQERLPDLGTDDLVLLLSFNRDRSYNDFSYDESILLISERSPVPIYGLWDFYLGKGLLGGMLIRGYNQGELVGSMVFQYLMGTPLAEIPIVKESPNSYMFDKLQLDKYHINEHDLPKGSLIINRSFSFLDFWNENRLFLILVFSLSLISILLYQNMRLTKFSEKKEKQFALTDPLTGIPNRRAGFEHLERVVLEFKDTETPVTICFADMNNLKYINDTFGHNFGDDLIKTFSKIVSEGIRSNDFISRIGGDEFLITFPGVRKDDIEEIWKRIDAQIEKVNDTHEFQFSISASVGFAEYQPEEYSTIFDFVDRADQEMYIQKKKDKGHGV